MQPQPPHARQHGDTALSVKSSTDDCKSKHAASSAASTEAMLRVLNSPAMRASRDQAAAAAESVRQVMESSGMYAEAQRAVAAAAAQLDVLGKASGRPISPAGGRTS